MFQINALVVALLLGLSSYASAEFTLDCGRPLKTSGWAPSQTDESYQVEFKGFEVNLLVTQQNGKVEKARLHPFFFLDGVVEFFGNTPYQNVSILKNKNGHFINILGGWHSRCE